MLIEQGQAAVVTGGASGIGLALATALGARGVRVVVSDIRPEGLETAVATLRERDIEAYGVVADVSDTASVDALATAARAVVGEVDLLCSNAGLVAPGAPMWEQELSAWDRAIGVKLRGVIHGVRAFVPAMVRRGRGHVLHTASSGGLAPLPGRSPYSATMHAVVGLTETLDAELRAVAPTLGATVLCPGLVDTPLGMNSASLGAIDLPPAMLTPDAIARMRATLGDALSAAEVADAALQAIEQGRVHVAPGADVLSRARARVEHLLADIALDAPAD